ncbi:MAG: helix-turn-helix transcriptional regulator [Pirellulaceae bacterium]
MSKSTGEDGIFVKRLREARESRGLSQSELAERAGLQPSAVSHFETGRRSPSFHNLRKLSDALGVTIDYLLGRVDQSRAVSPLAEKLYRHLGQMSQEDQENLADFANMLARKNKKRTEEK